MKIPKDEMSTKMASIYKWLSEQPELAFASEVIVIPAAVVIYGRLQLLTDTINTCDAHDWCEPGNATWFHGKVPGLDVGIDFIEGDMRGPRVMAS